MICCPRSHHWMAQGLLFLALVSAAADTSEGAAPKFFTFFSYGYKKENHVALTSEFANVCLDQSLPFLLNQSLPAALQLSGYPCRFGGAAEPSLHHPPPSPSPDPFCLFASAKEKQKYGTWLASDWRTTAAAIARAVADHKLVGVLLGDELVCKGLPLSNLSAIATELRTQLPAKIRDKVWLYTNECFETGDPCKTSAGCRGSGAGAATCASGTCQPAAWPYMPRDLDYISLDAYQTTPNRAHLEAQIARGEKSSCTAARTSIQNVPTCLMA